MSTAIESSKSRIEFGQFRVIDESRGQLSLELDKLTQRTLFDPHPENFSESEPSRPVEFIVFKDIDAQDEGDNPHSQIEMRSFKGASINYDPQQLMLHYKEDEDDMIFDSVNNNSFGFTGRSALNSRRRRRIASYRR